jgi:uncharacterized protein DUF5684
VDTGFVVGLVVTLLASWAIAIFILVCLWRVYTKAGQPGWAAIVPFYNVYVLLKIVGRPGWWLVWYFVPIANVVVMVIVTVELAVAFGKSGGFAVLLIFLPFIGLPILAFGDATYRGPIADPNFGRYPQAPHIPQQYPYPQQQYPYPPQQPGPPPQEQYPPR